jgi:hypothetical protein
LQRDVVRHGCGAPLFLKLIEVPSAHPRNSVRQGEMEGGARTALGVDDVGTEYGFDETQPSRQQVRRYDSRM